MATPDDATAVRSKTFLVHAAHRLERMLEFGTSEIRIPREWDGRFDVMSFAGSMGDLAPLLRKMISMTAYPEAAGSSIVPYT